MVHCALMHVLTLLRRTVLSGTDKNATLAKGKNAAIDKWDQETRAALAAKKKASQGTSTLSKADKALVDAQLAKENEVRARIKDALARVHQSLRIIRSLLSLSSGDRDGFLPPMIFALLEAATGKNCELFGEEAFQTTLVSSKSTNQNHVMILINKCFSRRNFTTRHPLESVMFDCH